MHHRAKDITGMKIHWLTALSYCGSDGKKSLWNVQCDCGKIIVMAASEFLKERQQSCGCQRYLTIGRKNSTHKMSTHPVYAVWRGMLARCSNPKHRAWLNYGGRGISVCEEWQNSFEEFWQDMSESYVFGLCLDRENNEGNYEKSNCRWVTHKVNDRNKRNNTRLETPWGRITISEAAERSGIGKTTLCYRLSRGVSGKDLFSKPDVTNRFTT